MTYGQCRKLTRNEFGWYSDMHKNIDYSLLVCVLKYNTTNAMKINLMLKIASTIHMFI